MASFHPRLYQHYRHPLRRSLRLRLSHLLQLQDICLRSRLHALLLPLDHPLLLPLLLFPDHL